MVSTHVSVKSRKAQLSAIKKKFQLPKHFFASYDKKEDVINIGTPIAMMTLRDKHLDRDDYMDVAMYSYGRLMEVLDDQLLNMPVMGHA